MVPRCRCFLNLCKFRYIPNFVNRQKNTQLRTIIKKNLKLIYLYQLIVNFALLSVFDRLFICRLNL